MHHKPFRNTSQHIPAPKVKNHFALIVFDRSVKRFFAFNPKQRIRILTENELFGLSHVARNELLNAGYSGTADFQIRPLVHAPVIGGVQYHFTMATVPRVLSHPNLVAIPNDRNGCLTRLAAETLVAVKEATALLGSATTTAA